MFESLMLASMPALGIEAASFLRNFETTHINFNEELDNNEIPKQVRDFFAERYSGKPDPWGTPKIIEL